MSRLVTALYDTRPQAETARARLGAELQADNMRILAADTAAAVDTFKLSAKDADHYRQELKNGSYLLVANVPAGQDPQRIVTLLESTVAGAARPRHDTDGHAEGRVIEEARYPRVSEELRIGTREVERGGARVRSFTRETPATEQVALRDEHVEIDSRAADRRLSEDEVVSAGLLKDRVIEVSEMREEPVITKSAVIREEILLKKTVTERVETVHETLRHTEVDVDELPARDAGSEPRASGRVDGRDKREAGRS
jgi:stress response protein YsnF